MLTSGDIPASSQVRLLTGALHLRQPLSSVSSCLRQSWPQVTMFPLRLQSSGWVLYRVKQNLTSHPFSPSLSFCSLRLLHLSWCGMFNARSDTRSHGRWQARTASPREWRPIKSHSAGDEKLIKWWIFFFSQGKGFPHTLLSVIIFLTTKYKVSILIKLLSQAFRQTTKLGNQFLPLMCVLFRLTFFSPHLASS